MKKSITLLLLLCSIGGAMAQQVYRDTLKVYKSSNDIVLHDGTSIESSRLRNLVSSGFSLRDDRFVVPIGSLSYTSASTSQEVFDVVESTLGHEIISTSGGIKSYLDVIEDTSSTRYTILDDINNIEIRLSRNNQLYYRSINAPRPTLCQHCTWVESLDAVEDISWEYNPIQDKARFQVDLHSGIDLDDYEVRLIAQYLNSDSGQPERRFLDVRGGDNLWTAGTDNLLQWTNERVIDRDRRIQLIAITYDAFGNEVDRHMEIVSTGVNFRVFMRDVNSGRDVWVRTGNIELPENWSSAHYNFSFNVGEQRIHSPITDLRLNNDMSEGYFTPYTKLPTHGTLRTIRSVYHLEFVEFQWKGTYFLAYINESRNLVTLSHELSAMSVDFSWLQGGQGDLHSEEAGTHSFSLGGTN